MAASRQQKLLIVVVGVCGAAAMTLATASATAWTSDGDPGGRGAGAAAPGASCASQPGVGGGPVSTAHLTACFPADASTWGGHRVGP